MPTDQASNAGERAVVAILKHNTPCGVGAGATPLEAYQNAFATDPDSPFGGIIVSNRPFDLDLAKAVDEIFTEVLIAPSFTDDALEFLKKKKNRRLLSFDRDKIDQSQTEVRRVFGGLLVQESDPAPEEVMTAEVATDAQPSDEQRTAMEFAWRVVKHVKSNAIVFANHDRTLAIGGGDLARRRGAQRGGEGRPRRAVARRLRARERRLLPVPGRARGGGRSRGGSGRPAGRIEPRRVGHRGGEQAGRADAHDRQASLPSLSPRTPEEIAP